MKKYKNISLSLTSYVLAIVWYLLGLSLGSILHIQTSTNATANILNGLVVYPSLLLVLIGMFFSLKSIKTKEAGLLGNFLLFLGLVCLALPYILIFIGARM